MFQPETEDMLPRIAPKPTTGPGLNEPAALPTVPEVSILFNQQNPASATVCSTSETQQCKPQQSYASWKKSVLPKVIYPAVAENGSSSSTQNKVAQSSQNYAELHSNVFPLRAAPPKNLQFSTDSYRRSLESCIPSHNSSPDVQVFDGVKPTLAQLHQQQQMRRSLDALPQQPITTPPPPLARTRSQHSEVLTICAGTQTESCSFRGISVEEQQQLLLNMLATKNDFKNLTELIQEMREEQLRLTQICAVLLEYHYQDSAKNKLETISKDVSTQCDTNRTDIVQESGPLKGSQDTNNRHQQYATEARTTLQHGLISNQDALTPRPAAHSTKYRQNTPQPAYKKQGLQQQLTPQHNKVLSIPATEQSLVMNELALKYLPNDKLNELMQELQMASPTNQKTAVTDENFNCNQGKFATTPLRNIDNFDKGPNDLSNASYKYLKKYRLLPEVPQIEHITSITPKCTRLQKNNYQRDQSPQSGSHSVPQENMLDLDAIRRQPKFL